MAAKNTPNPHVDLDGIKHRFGQALANKRDGVRHGASRADAGSRIAPRGPVPRKQKFRRKTG